MWLTCSSVGRKFIMAITGACLVLFVTFHCLMNAVAIFCPAAYNSVCELLGANWYALVASAGLALLFIIHIIYAIWLTLQNRRARGADRYSISRRPKTVEWSSQNMLVLGIVVIAFLIVHLIQFWAKMQLVEVLGIEGEIPPTAGTLFIQEAFSQIWTPIVYIIGFIALWFHLTHGFWSMFQTVGWDSTVWIPRLKKISCWWTTIVIALFVAQAIVFTVRANEDYYKTDETLRDQYAGMLAPVFEKGFGKEVALQVRNMGYEQLQQITMQTLAQMNNPQVMQANATNPDFQKQLDTFKHAQSFFNYINGASAEEEAPAQVQPFN